MTPTIGFLPFTHQNYQYSGKDIMSLQKQGIHVIVIDRNSKEVTNARLACQGYTPEQ